MKTLVIVQSRLGSTRLPKKALLDLQGVPVLAWVLRVAKKINADNFVLATDEESASAYKEIASVCGFDLFAGDKDDVLKRFCDVIKNYSCDTVLRITGDNPFICYEAANASLLRFSELDCDYFTFSGLPHGCGVEVIKASSLLVACEETVSTYDHEHVAPSLYLHKEKWNCVFEKAPKNWNYPEFRTTIDTEIDYCVAKKRSNILQESKDNLNNFLKKEPPAFKEILKANITTVIFVPLVKKNTGTGHFVRCCKLAQKLNQEKGFLSFVALREPSSVICSIREDFFDVNFIDDFSFDEAKITNVTFFVFDNFVSKKEELILAKKIAPVIVLDEGSVADDANYLLDIIPSGLSSKRLPNKTAPYFLATDCIKKTASKKSDKKNILVSFGGEDSCNKTSEVVNVLKNCIKEKNALITVCGFVQDDFFLTEKNNSEIINKFLFQKRIENLSTVICDYDLVITHYGLTAYEAALSGCGVLLLAPTELHKKLSIENDFAFCDSVDKLDSFFSRLFTNDDIFYSYKKNHVFSEKKNDSSLLEFIKLFSSDKITSCPVCDDESKILFRFEKRNFRKCLKCDLVFQESFIKKNNYEKEYFFEDYKNQYGKTYIEDFENIKQQGFRRIKIIDSLLDKKNKKTLLDVGCAYGPFLAAASEDNYKVFGNDISLDAVSFVKNDLHFSAMQGDFFNTEFNNKFDVITMWYVIEHFENLYAVLKKVSDLLESGGVFAFSTPYLDGVSGKTDKKLFCNNSPFDHVSIWNKKSAKIILRQFGICLKKIVSTGHHPERFLIYKKIKNNFGEESFVSKIIFKVLKIWSRLFSLGDTFEVYGKKI